MAGVVHVTIYTQGASERMDGFHRAIKLVRLHQIQILLLPSAHACPHMHTPTYPPPPPHTHTQSQTGTMAKKHFSCSVGLETCKFAKMLRSIFSLSHIYHIYEEIRINLYI
jgi:hypothetical protein